MRDLAEAAVPQLDTRWSKLLSSRFFHRVPYPARLMLTAPALFFFKLPVSLRAGQHFRWPATGIFVDLDEVTQKRATLSLRPSKSRMAG